MYNKPLSQTESSFAAKNHYLVSSFLRQKGYPEDDFYDVVIFGYLQAVRAYLERPELQNFAFSTIAFSRMRGSMGNHFRSAELRPKTVSFDEELIAEYHPSAEAVLIERECAAELYEMNRTPQAPVLRLVTEEYELLAA